MSTETVPEIDVDVTSDVPCEWMSGVCRNPATWLGILVCCRKQAPACNECRGMYIQAARRLGACLLVCKCGHVTTAIDSHEWRPL